MDNQLKESIMESKMLDFQLDNLVLDELGRWSPIGSLNL